MCRMLAIAGQNKIKADLLERIWDSLELMSLDKTMVHEFNEDKFGKFIHNDGWGIAFRNSSGNITLHKTATEIWEDKLPEKIREEVLKQTSLMIHTRMASPGLNKKNIDYVHPFILDSSVGTFVLVHNGTIRDQSQFTFDEKFALEAENSDTNKFLLALVTSLEKQEHTSPSVVGKHILDFIMGLEGYASVNLLVYHLHKGQTHLYCTTNFNNDKPRYLMMQMLRTDEHIIVSSEKIDAIDGEWEDLANHSLIRVNIDDIEDNEIITA